MSSGAAQSSSVSGLVVDDRTGRDLSPSPGAERPHLGTEQDRTIYALGLALAESVNRFQLTESELALVSRGLSDGVMEQAQIRLDEYAAKIDALVEARSDRAFRQRERTGTAFRSRALATLQGAVKTESGAIAIPVREGSGARPDTKDRVRIIYEGRLLDGTVFDRTEANTSLIVTVGDTAVPCLTEALRRMQVGAVQRMICPPARDFFHPRIEVGSTLIYDIELLQIVRGVR